ncbi:MAG: bifunctional (p)ppGpp synthetase/guanosine-3',5'-bis(diphosphate) 3'-pyrophosphohydrolase [Bacteroidaceae bacterium]|nr:bifunctional (p)ppGpp synthetase/guanosine-3',5'-bis(diphosphate) 3'-pyrophosphohydrolase [Bacteroidaceae bacterium]MBQ4380469.1 bifunctional (p)ppGpp synthetase/guanosine-3',5'-bis(diphosphate) 3'-pyrophosphohydrolase [Bacteroidaceae bacterium]
MDNTTGMTSAEQQLLKEEFKRLQSIAEDTFQAKDLNNIRTLLKQAAEKGQLQRDVFGLYPLLFDLQTAVILAEEIGLNRASLLAVMIHNYVEKDKEKVKHLFGQEVANIVAGLNKVNEIYQKTPVVETENFRDLILSFAEDMRVIFIIIANRVNLMRQIKDKGTEEERRKVANEASVLYAPLAHKLGLYLIKRELEDLSLKYLKPDVYYMIKDKLNETRASRDRYIANFIGPIEEKLKAANLHFHIKGRTKSIHSIWQKMQKQKCQFEGIYDLFAIRVILDSKIENEKLECWQVFSIVTDMYRPNPKRLRDWLSVPKSNGYESLHITVMGPEGKWVEVQIRTERMDEVAERGLAAHWRYKGVKDSGTKLEDWLKDVRSALENQTTSDEQLINQFKVDLYSDEVFVFTPKGDLFKLQKGATVLDFAFHIHTNIGCKCIGGMVNGKNVPIYTRLQSGDQVEILTSNKQIPKRDWLNFAVTTKARNKIRQSLHEQEAKNAAFAKEDLERKFKHHKIEPDEGTMMRMVKKLGYKQMNDFYRAISDRTIDSAYIVEKYKEQLDREANPALYTTENRSADGFVRNATDDMTQSSGDVLVIDNSVKGVEYSLAKCCNPIYGDDVFGFVTINRGIKIHRSNCPNAERLKERMSYRVIRAQWAGKGSSQYAVILHVVGNDDIGIVNNLTSIINKEKNITLRGISIQSSEDGLFSGTLTVMIDDNKQIEQLIKKMKTVKGIKNISR